MTRRLHTLTALAAIAVLTAACNPFGSTSSAGSLPEDPRFADFTYETDGEIEVQERTDSFNERMLALGATEGHVTVGRFPEGRGVPMPDDHMWLTGVGTVPPETIQKLSEGADGNNTLLPGIYPRLYQYVPQDCHFSTIPADHANVVLQSSTDIYSEWGSFTITAFAASADCNLIIVTGEGTRD